jgi:hypothetical protein
LISFDPELATLANCKNRPFPEHMSSIAGGITMTCVYRTAVRTFLCTGLVSVHSDASEWTKKAKEILEGTGAQDISATGEAAAEKGDKARVHEVA